MSKREAGFLTTALNIGIKRLYVSDTYRAKRRDAMHNPGLRAQMIDYIFGKTDQHPLEKEFSEYLKALEELEAKSQTVAEIYEKYSNTGV